MHLCNSVANQSQPNGTTIPPAPFGEILVEKEVDSYKRKRQKERNCLTSKDVGAPCFFSTSGWSPRQNENKIKGEGGKWGDKVRKKK